LEREALDLKNYKKRYEEVLNEKKKLDLNYSEISK